MSCIREPFIVTSRNKDVLDARCTHVSEVQLLPEGHDMQLFKAWAFAAGPPVWDTSVLVPDMVACCGRLPLTLKVGAANALGMRCEYDIDAKCMQEAIECHFMK